MSRTKLAAARELIEEKQYVEARALLLTIKDDPTAAKWLAQLETRMGRQEEAPQFTPIPPRAKNYTIVPQQEPLPVPPNTLDQQRYRQYPEPVPQNIPAVENTRVAGCFRLVWGILTLLSVAWILYGLAVSASVTGNQLNSVTTRNSQAAQAGTLIGGSLGVTLFLCTGLPCLLIFGLLYWRNGVAIRETKKHNQMVAAMQQRR